MLCYLLLFSQICFWKITFVKLLLLLIATFTEGVCYCCFRKAFSQNLFQNVLLANFISTCVNLLRNFFFAHFLLIEGYGKCALRKKLVIAPFVEQFKSATLRKSDW